MQVVSALNSEGDLSGGRMSPAVRTAKYDVVMPSITHDVGMPCITRTMPLFMHDVVNKAQYQHAITHAWLATYKLENGIAIPCMPRHGMRETSPQPCHYMSSCHHACHYACHHTNHHGHADGSGVNLAAEHRRLVGFASCSAHGRSQSRQISRPCSRRPRS